VAKKASNITGNNFFIFYRLNFNSDKFCTGIWIFQEEVYKFLIFFFHQQKFIVFQRRKALIVTEIVNPAVAGLVDVGKVVEVESQFNHRVFVCCGFIVVVQFFEDGIVFFQDTVDFPDVIC
jgi:hypothetical protein